MEPAWCFAFHGLPYFKMKVLSFIAVHDGVQFVIPLAKLEAVTRPACMVRIKIVSTKKTLYPKTILVDTRANPSLSDEDYLEP